MSELILIQVKSSPDGVAPARWAGFAGKGEMMTLVVAHFTILDVAAGEMILELQQHRGGAVARCDGVIAVRRDPGAVDEPAISGILYGNGRDFEVSFCAPWTTGRCKLIRMQIREKDWAAAVPSAPAA